MTKEEIEEVLRAHALWCSNKDNGGRANLTGVYLRGADLTGADLTQADLRGTNLADSKLPHFQLCPEVGQFRAYKKVQGGHILELLISKRALRTSSLVGRKCRASRVKVMGVVGGSSKTRFSSIYNSDFTYEVGKWIEVPNFDPDIRVECTRGIHFFMTMREAEEYR